MVGKHTAGPTNVNVIHSATSCLFLDSVGRLLLSTNEKNVTAFCSDITDEHIRLFKLFNGLLKVDDVDSVSFGEDVLTHFGVPSSGMMSKMDASFEKLLD